jgi:response regulator NasT
MKPNIESGATILLVDDERLVLSTLSMGLVRAGYRVVTAESVDDAEEFLAGGERPDLVILDVRMPGTSGLVLAERLRSLDHVPFLLLTACSDQETVDRATASGALGYLVKPVDTPQLIPAIKAALARAREIHGLEETGRQLQKALNNEREISIATGITMAQYHLDRKAAFELLRKSARNQGRKLADLAAEIIRASEALNLGSE